MSKHRTINLREKMNSIHEAAVAGDIELLKLLIDNGGNVNFKDSKGLHPLHYAAWQGRTESVFILLRSAANVNEQSFNGETPLHLASQHGHHEIVQLLLFHHADSSLLNRRALTAMELACEYGHFQVVNLLLHDRFSEKRLVSTKGEQQQHNPLNLAAKNGHTDIVRLLLLNGMDINRLTSSDGSALHAACRNGRYETAKLLLECGIDIHLCNAYQQTADEVVIKQKSGSDIKRLIKEFSDAIFVRAIRSYTDNHVGALNFTEGDGITVLDRNPTGQWRGFILQDDLTTRTGYFPSAYIQLNPTIINSKDSSSYRTNHSPLDNDSMMLRYSQTDSDLIPNPRSTTNHIYRHSAASSIDSGRSSTALYDSPKIVALTSFLTIHDTRSIGSSNDSKSSDPDKTSSRSSNDSLNESGILDINTLLRNGTGENEIISAWLKEFAYENYAENFLTNGYDIQTIVRMTPEDLTAIGITHPSHRRKIKNEIARLRLTDGLPDFKPDTLYDWLCYLRLDEYISLLNKQNYRQLSDILNIVWEDLEEIGITRLGHQKRFMLGIKRLIAIDKGLHQSNRHQITIERYNSLENNHYIPNDESSTYATLRRTRLSPNTLIYKHRIKSSGISPSIPTSSFRLPPPLSSPLITTPHSMSSNRTRSLENIPSNNPQLDQYEPITSDYVQPSNLSSSTESNNGIPFANETIGTIKQRSSFNHYTILPIAQPFETMKRSLPMEFFQKANNIYDNSERFIRKNKHNRTLSNTDKRSQYIEVFSNVKQNRLIKKDTSNVLSDIDSMLSDLNRELDQMLDYERTTLK